MHLSRENETKIVKITHSAQCITTSTLVSASAWQASSARSLAPMQFKKDVPQTLLLAFVLTLMRSVL